MALNPIPVLFVCVLVYTVQGFMLDGEALEVDYPDLDFDGGFLSFWASAFESVEQFLPFVGQFLLLGPLGVPAYIGVPFLFICSGTVLWSIAELLRGT